MPLIRIEGVSRKAPPHPYPVDALPHRKRMLRVPFNFNALHTHRTSRYLARHREPYCQRREYGQRTLCLYDLPNHSQHIQINCLTLTLDYAIVIPSAAIRLPINKGNQMKNYTVGTKVFCDFHFGGKPRGIAVEIVEPGTGNGSSGKIRIRLTETVGAYNKGEIVELDSLRAVPCAQELKLSKGQFFRRVSTDYAWVN